MTPTRQKRLKLILIILFSVGTSSALILKGMEESISYFIMPSDVNNMLIQPDRPYRIGGTVKTGSITRLENGVTTRFLITDCLDDVAVEYTGILPDLFREGQSIIADGLLTRHRVFKAKLVLAKHDENYMPSELADTMLAMQAQQCQTDNTV